MTNGFLARHRSLAAWLGGGLAVVFGIAWLLIFTGTYNIAADAPHTGPVHWLLDNVRQHSIAVRAKGIAIPADLGDPKRIAAGAGLYNEMCTGCHLGPGLERTEMSRGLYPKAPELARRIGLSPAEEFWVIKHGIKMTAMPAWGPTHSDTLIWDMVAFLQKLPGLTPGQYRTVVKSAPEDHDEMMHDMQDMPGMAEPHGEHRH